VFHLSRNWLLDHWLTEPYASVGSKLAAWPKKNRCVRMQVSRTKY